MSCRAVNGHSCASCVSFNIDDHSTFRMVHWRSSTCSSISACSQGLLTQCRNSCGKRTWIHCLVCQMLLVCAT